MFILYDIFLAIHSLFENDRIKIEYLFKLMEFGEGKIGGKYAVGPKIGSGSFGEVYLVNNFGTEEIYALKKVTFSIFRKMRKQNTYNYCLRQRFSKTSRDQMDLLKCTGKEININRILW